MTAWKKVQARGVYAEGSRELSHKLNQMIEETFKQLGARAVEIVPIGVSSEVGDYKTHQYFELLVLYGTPVGYSNPDQEETKEETILVVKTYTPEKIEAAARVNYWIRATAAKDFPKWEELTESQRADERHTIREIIRELEG